MVWSAHSRISERRFDERTGQPLPTKYTHNIVDETGRTIACVEVHVDEPTSPRAVLMAAAPEMLEALKTIRHKLDNYDGESLGTIAAIADAVIGKAEDSKAAPAAEVGA